MVESSGVFQETANKGAYVLTHNANKLSTHEYYMAGRAFAGALIFSGDPPAVLSAAIYDYITKGYDHTKPSRDEVPYVQHREIIKKVRFILA